MPVKEELTWKIYSIIADAAWLKTFNQELNMDLKNNETFEADSELETFVEWFNHVVAEGPAINLKVLK